MLVLNIIQNAFHAMLEHGTLKIETQIGNGEVTISFVDNGVGISPEDKIHLFEPFFSHRADGINGTGLGLTICQSIVQRYKGRIEVEDVRPQGAAFRIIIPEAGNTKPSPARTKPNAGVQAL
jgi:signal transduction histidine kinase